MAGGIQLVDASGNPLAFETDKKAQRTVVVNRGVGFSMSGITGTVSATLSGNSTVFAMRFSPSATNVAFIDKVVVRYTTIAAYTTPVTAGRRLALFRGAGAAASGGTTPVPPVARHLSLATSDFLAASGGSSSISTTGALTVTGITYEADPISVYSLVHLGAAGAYAEFSTLFTDCGQSALVIKPGQVLAIRNPAAMDAGGTWQMAVEVSWREAGAF